MQKKKKKLLANVGAAGHAEFVSSETVRFQNDVAKMTLHVATRAFSTMDSSLYPAALRLCFNFTVHVKKSKNNGV